MIATFRARAPGATSRFGSIGPFNCALRGYADIFRVPPMAENIEQGTLTSLQKKIGDHVATGETVATIWTPTLEIPVKSTVSGKVTDILVSVDETVVRNQPLFEVEDSK